MSHGQLPELDVAYTRDVAADSGQQKLMDCHSAAQHKPVENASQKARCHRFLCVRIKAIFQEF